MEESQEKDYSFLETTRSPTFTMYQFMSENLRVNIWRDIYEQLLKTEPSITKLIVKLSDISKLSTLSQPSITKFIENQCEHLSKLTLYHLKKRDTRPTRHARQPSRIPLLFLRGLNNKNSMLKKFVFKKISTIHTPAFKAPSLC